MNPLTTALLPLLGLVIGATLQYWFTQLSESRKQRQSLQTQSYVDYLRAVTRSAYASTPEANRAANMDAADAKARLAVYGTSGVISALARFEGTSAVIDNPKARAAFITLVGAMRRKPAQGDDLNLVLFGKR